MKKTKKRAPTPSAVKSRKRRRIAFTQPPPSHADSDEETDRSEEEDEAEEEDNDEMSEADEETPPVSTNFEDSSMLTQRSVRARTTASKPVAPKLPSRLPTAAKKKSPPKTRKAAPSAAGSQLQASSDSGRRSATVASPSQFVDSLLIVTPQGEYHQLRQRRTRINYANMVHAASQQ